MMPFHSKFLIPFLFALNLSGWGIDQADPDVFTFSNRTYKLRRDLKNLKAQNVQNRLLGSVTGTIVVTLKSAEDFQSFLKTSGFRITSSAPQINTLFIKVKNRREPLSELREIQNDSRVKSAELEVIEQRLKIK